MTRETWIGKHPGHDEEAAVRADNARLRAEVARLTREINDRIDYDKQIVGERDALRTQREEWRARAIKLGWVDDGNV